MSLNIKNEEVHRLAAELAAMTGMSMTAVVEQALQEKMARERAAKEARKEKMIREMDAITKRSSALVKGKKYMSDDDFLYDDRGMPK